MILGISLAFLAMRAGLKLRQGRTQAGTRTRAMRDAHLRLAKPAVVVVVVGFAAGVASAYFLRYAVFAMTSLPVGVIVASQFLHGFCYACFFAVGYIYVDRLAEKDVRHSAQTVFGIIILGVGPVVAAPRHFWSGGHP